MSSSSSSRILVLRSSDGEEHVAVKSQTIKNIIVDCSNSVIPIPNVTSTILRKVFEYCRKHVDAPTGNDLKDWDKKFADVDQETLYHLVMGANFVDIRDLLGLLTKTVADRIRGKQVEEIREYFHIKNDFEPEEEAQIRKDNEWALV